MSPFATFSPAQIDITHPGGDHLGAHDHVGQEEDANAEKHVAHEVAVDQVEIEPDGGGGTQCHAALCLRVTKYILFRLQSKRLHLNRNEPHPSKK